MLASFLRSRVVSLALLVPRGDRSEHATLVVSFVYVQHGVSVKLNLDSTHA